jgi:hypothetical protein
MLIQQVNPISLETLQRCIGHFFDVLGATVQAGLFAILDFEPELGGDHYLVTKWSQRFAHQFFICEWAIDFGSIEEGYAAFDSGSDQRDPLLLLYGWAIAKTQPHAPEPDGRNFKIAFSELAFLHYFSFHKSS